MASCLPGCESLEQLGEDRYRAVVAVALAGVKARFDLQVEVTERLADGVRATTRGEEGGNASTLQATSEVRLTPNAGGTHVDYRSEVAVTGRLGRFALGMMKKKAQSLGDEFAANLQRALAAAPQAVDAATPSPAAAAAPGGRCAGASPAVAGSAGDLAATLLVAALRAVAARPLRLGLAGTSMSAVQQGMLWPRTVDEATAMLAADPEAQAARRRRHAGGDDERPRPRAAGARQSRRASTSCAASAARPTAACASAPSRATRETAACALLRGAGRASCGRRPAKIANATVRNMGTIGGSISFADPGLDYPPALVAADASIEIAGPSRAPAGRRPPTSSSTGTRPRSSRARSSPPSSSAPRTSAAPRT